ncbi:MAG: efflux RND transporter permease subunit, partial [Candidatus Theseobacter exili]|nr:efflux RND transporter permease subunit [Candidatus Theseobacter exili]
YADNHFKSGNLKVRITGSNYLAARMLELLTIGQIRSLIIMLLIVFLAFWIYYRSLSLAIIAMIPNSLPIGVSLAVMGFLGIDLNIATVFLFNITIGISVDDTFHLLDHYRNWLKQKPGNYEEAIVNMLTGKVKPVMATSLAISVGIFILIFSNFVPLNLFGIFVALAIVFCLMGDLIALPALLAIRDELLYGWKSIFIKEQVKSPTDTQCLPEYQ